MIYVTVGVVLLLVLVAATLHHVSLGFYEFDGAFMTVMLILLLFLIGSAVYLSFALPTLADKPMTLFRQQKELRVTRDSASGILFEE